ncbi:TPA: hypothetical protein ACHYZF_002206 [Escherichia coli]
MSNSKKCFSISNHGMMHARTVCRATYNHCLGHAMVMMVVWHSDRTDEEVVAITWKCTEQEFKDFQEQTSMADIMFDLQDGRYWDHRRLVHEMEASGEVSPGMAEFMRKAADAMENYRRNNPPQQGEKTPDDAKVRNMPIGCLSPSGIHIFATDSRQS